MASPAASSVLLMLLVVFTAGASASIFSVVNQCPYTVWPAAIPVGGGTQLNPGQTWTLNIPAGTSAARIWGRTGCSFNGGRGGCWTGDCAGAFSCGLSGRPPATLAEFSLGGATDYYDISVIDGFNVPMAFLCGNSGPRCYGNRCPDAYLYPSDNSKVHTCPGNSNYRVIFCP